MATTSTTGGASPAARIHPAMAVASATPRTGAGRRLARSWGRGWLALAQLVLDALLSAPYLAVVGIAVSGVTTVWVFFTGVPLLALALLLAFLLAYVERLRLLTFTGAVVVPGPPPRRDQALWRRVVLDRRPWAALLHQLLIGLWGLTIGVATTFITSVSLAVALLPAYLPLAGGDADLPFGVTIGPPTAAALAVVAVLVLLMVPWAAAGLVRVDVALGRWLLGAGSHEQVRQLTARVETLRQTRERAVDSVEAERRRIERDLHDGPQQRLVALAIDLGMARERLERDPTGASGLLERAHTAAKEAIVEMRQVARGIHPPVLTDRGLDAALSALASRSPVPVYVQVSPDLVAPGRARPPAAIEAIAYFCVSEALTNVAKHSGAAHAWVQISRTAMPGAEGAVPRELLTVTVTDDGRGGAAGLDGTGGLDGAADRGTGLRGLADRARAVDGQMHLSSPVGGPTVLTVQLPFPLSDPSMSGGAR